MDEHQTTTRGTIEQWFKEGVFEGWHYMLIVCDQFDYGDYPSYANVEVVEHRVEEYLEMDLSDVHEVYDLRMDMDDQLAEKRAWHLPFDQSGPPPMKGMALTCGCDLTAQMLATAEVQGHNAPVVVCPTHGLTVLTTQS